MHDAAVLVAEEGLRRSLRIRWRTENALLLAEGIHPFYTYALFGESDWYLDDGFQVGLRITRRLNKASAPPDIPPPPE